MNVDEACRKIFDIALPFAQSQSSPVAYIDVMTGIACPLKERDLWKAFNKIKWDTPLTTAELEFFHTPDPDFAKNISVTGIVEFEDEHGKAQVHKVDPAKGAVL